MIYCPICEVIENQSGKEATNKVHSHVQILLAYCIFYQFWAG